MAVRKRKRVLVKAAYGVGKTHLAGGLTNWWYDCKPRSKILTTAPTGQQVSNLLWVEIRSQRKTEPGADIKQIRDPEDPEHLAVGYSPSKSTTTEFGVQALQGMHAEYLLVIFDEAAGVDAARWLTAEDLIVYPENRFLAIGNPLSPTGSFYNAARSGRWHVITISALDHPNIKRALYEAGWLKEPPKHEYIPGAVSLEWVQDKLENPFWVENLGELKEEDALAVEAEGAFSFMGIWYMPAGIAEAKILARFPTTLTDTIWSLAWLERARERELEYTLDKILHVGVDVGRYGSDPSAMHMRTGPISLDHISWRKSDTMETAGRVWRETLDAMAKYELNRAYINVDVIGIGSGVADRLSELAEAYENIIVNDINVSERALESDKYVNLRTELWFNAASLGHRGDLDLSRLSENDYALISSQLSAPKHKYRSDGRIIAEGKDELRKDIGRSPDDADAFNLAYISGTVSGRMSETIPTGDEKPSTWTDGVGRWGDEKPRTRWTTDEGDYGGGSRWSL